MSLLQILTRTLESGDPEGDFLDDWRRLIQSPSGLMEACRSAFNAQDDVAVARCLSALQNNSKLLEHFYSRTSPYDQLGIDVSSIAARMESLLRGTWLSIVIASRQTQAAAPSIAGDSWFSVVGQPKPDFTAASSSAHAWDLWLRDAAVNSNVTVSVERAVLNDLFGKRRTSRQSVTLPVLYYYGDRGYSCRLRCDALIEGTGDVFADPESMTLAPLASDFIRSVNDSWTLACRLINLPNPISIDIRWSLDLSDLPTGSNDMPQPLVGPSMGATLAIVFWQLLAGEEVDNHWALTAEVKQDGRLTTVGGIVAKAKDWFESQGERGQMLVCEKDAAEAKEGARVARIRVPGQHVHVVRTIDEINQTLISLARERWGGSDTRPLVSPRFTGRANALKYVQRFVEEDHAGYLVLQSGIGTGKSELMAKLIDDAFRQGRRPIFHQVRQQETADDVGAAITRQLLRKYQHQIQWSTSQISGSRLSDLLHRIHEVVLEPEHRSDVIYIDGADQITRGETDGALLPDLLPAELPKRICCVITSRPAKHWYRDSARVRFEQLDSLTNDADDIRQFLKLHAGGALSESIINTLSDQSRRPNFLTFCKRLDELLLSEHAGTRLTQNVESWFEEPTNVIKQDLEQTKAEVERLDSRLRLGLSAELWRVLGRLAVLNENLTGRQLKDLGLWRQGITDRILDLSANFFHPVASDSTPYMFQHAGYQQAILDGLGKQQKAECLADIADACLRWEDLDSARTFAVLNLPQLLMLSRQRKKLTQIRNNREYLTERDGIDADEFGSLDRELLRIDRFLTRETRRFRQQTLAGIAACAVLGVGVLFITNKSAKTLENVDTNVEAVRADTGAIREDVKTIADTSREIKEDTAMIRGDTAGIHSDTSAIRESVAAIGKQRGLVSEPKTVADHYHNAMVHTRDGNHAAAEESFKRFFDLDESDCYDAYEQYVSLVLGNYSPPRAKRLIAALAERHPKNLSARLVEINETVEDNDEARRKISELIEDCPQFLPAYLCLEELIAPGLVIDDLAISANAAAFNAAGGVEAFKSFVLNPAEGRGKELLKAAEALGEDAPVDPMASLLNGVQVDRDITLLWLGVADDRPGREIVLTFPDDTVVKVPLDSPDNPAAVAGAAGVPQGLVPGSYVALELPRYRKGKKAAKPAFVPRSNDDVRIFPHAGDLEGVAIDSAMEVRISYVDAEGRTFRFPSTVKLFAQEKGEGGGVFAVEIERRDTFDPTPVLQITPATPMARVEVSGRAEGPFVPVPEHEGVPTMNEVACGAVPYLAANRGSTKLWVRGMSDEDDNVAAVGVEVDVPSAVRWKTFHPAPRPAGRAEADTTVELKFEPPNTYTDYYIDRVAFSPDGQRLAAMMERAGIVVWDIKSGRQTHLVEAETGKTLAFSADGTLVTNGLDIVALDGATKTSCLQPNYDTFGAAVSASFEIAATVDRSQRLDFFEFPSGKEAAVVELGHDHGFPTAVTISPDADVVAVAGLHVDIVWLVNRRAGKVQMELQVPETGITSIAFSFDGKHLLAAGPNSCVRLWNLPAGNDTAARHTLGDRSPTVAWTTRGVPLVADIGPAALTVTDARTGKAVAQVDGPVKRFAISPSGTEIAIAKKTSVVVRRID